MTRTAPTPLDGGCDGRALRHRLDSAPVFVHGRHCRWCQRESQASLAAHQPH